MHILCFISDGIVHLAVFPYFFFFRTSIEELDKQSCTDLPQKWGKLGQATSKILHKPVPIKEFCHVKPITSVYDKTLPEEIPEDLQQEIRAHFLLGSQ